MEKTPKKTKKSVNGRPTKMSNEFIEAFEKAIYNPFQVIIFTDTELVDAINEHLPKNKQIKFTLFQQWKKGQLPESEENKENVYKFLTYLKKAIRTQKTYIFEKLESEAVWQKYAWLAERKFKEWNLKVISEVKQETTTQINLNLNTDEEKAELSDFLDSIE